MTNIEHSISDLLGNPMKSIEQTNEGIKWKNETSA